MQRVFEVAANAVFFAQTLNKMQVGLMVLHAITAGVRRLAQPELNVSMSDAVLLKELRNDLPDRQLLENTLVGAVLQIGQARHQRQRIGGAMCGRCPFGNIVHMAVNPCAVKSRSACSLSITRSSA